MELFAAMDQRQNCRDFLDEPIEKEVIEKIIGAGIMASHALGLGSLWFTLFDKKSVKALLNIDDNKVPLAFVCLGIPTKVSAKTPRKPMAKKTVFID